MASRELRELYGGPFLMGLNKSSSLESVVTRITVCSVLTYFTLTSTGGSTDSFVDGFTKSQTQKILEVTCIWNLDIYTHSPDLSACA